MTPREQRLDLVAMHAPEAEENKIMMVLDAPESTISVLGDRGQLIQLFPNLLKNAVEAMSQGVTVTIRGIESTEPVTVQVLGEGVGFPSSLRANQPFFTAKPQKTGLGLSICRKIADFHWASLDLRPRIDCRGTIARIVFFLNLLEAQKEAVSNPRPESIVAPANSRQRA
jgi:signal transduction histidine kinase